MHKWISQNSTSERIDEINFVLLDTSHVFQLVQLFYARKGAGFFFDFPEVRFVVQNSQVTNCQFSASASDRENHILGFF